MGNPAIVATKPFLFLNDFLHNRLLCSYNLPDGSYYDFSYPTFLLILPMSLTKVFVAPVKSYDELKTLDLWHSLQTVLRLISIFPYSPGTLAGPHRDSLVESWVPSAVRRSCELFLALGFPCMAPLASQPGHGEVTSLLLFCRRLESEFECVASPGICAAQGHLVRQFHNFYNINPGLGI